MPESIYIHIPFCRSICSYCDFCKMYYNELMANNYLDSLEREIKDKYFGNLIKTIYIGGGTPSCLNYNLLNKLFDITKIINLDKDYEFTFECNISDISEELLVILKKNRVNRISIGVETINEKFYKLLNRYNDKPDIKEKINLVKKYFININLDLMYGFYDEDMMDLDNDLNFILDLDVPHISLYSLILEEHTTMYIDRIENIDSDLESDMYYHIISQLQEHGYLHYEISNFCHEGYESLHNLTYWNNECYYGFGLGSSGYISNVRYTNTRSLNNYLKGNYVVEKETVDEEKKIEYEMILGLRKIKGINKNDFFRKYKCHIGDIFDIISLIDKKLLEENSDYLYIPEDKLYVSNSILVNFVGGSNE